MQEYDPDISLSDEVLLVFYSDWSLPSLELIEAVRGLNSPEVVAIDVEAWPLLAYQNELRALPTMVLMRDGAEVRRKVGWCAERSISGILNDDL